MEIRCKLCHWLTTSKNASLEFQIKDGHFVIFMNKAGGVVEPLLDKSRSTQLWHGRLTFHNWMRKVENIPLIPHFIWTWNVRTQAYVSRDLVQRNQQDSENVWLCHNSDQLWEMMELVKHLHARFLILEIDFTFDKTNTKKVANTRNRIKLDFQVENEPHAAVITVKETTLMDISLHWNFLEQGRGWKEISSNPPPLSLASVSQSQQKQEKQCLKQLRVRCPHSFCFSSQSKKQSILKIKLWPEYQPFLEF